MTFKYRYRKQIVIVSLIIFVIALAGGYYVYNYKENEKTNKVLKTTKKKVTAKKVVNKEVKKDDEQEIMVDVKGEVVNSGIYKLKIGTRVIDAINMAGGLTENGDTSVLNLSKKLKDEMVIIVYSHYEVKNFEETKKVEQVVQSKCINGYDSVTNDACIEENKNEPEEIGTISINTATIEELTKLPGIGEAKAQSIIEYREVNGPFQAIEDIKNVDGIGDSLFEKIKDHITI